MIPRNNFISAQAVSDQQYLSPGGFCDAYLLVSLTTEFKTISSNSSVKKTSGEAVEGRQQDFSKKVVG